MAPKPRNRENKGLPARWRIKHGAYFYRVPPGQEHAWDGKTEFRLGKTLVEAHRSFATRFEAVEQIHTMGDLLDRYAVEVVPNKAPKSQESNRLSMRRLRAVFGTVHVSAILPRHAYRYRDEVTKKHGKASANRDLEVLSHSLTMAVEWGLLDRNPVKGQVRKHAIPRRERYIKDWEIQEACSVASDSLKAYIVLKLLTGLRRSDLLTLRTVDLQKDGIHVSTRKTGAAIIISWSDELREAVDAALASRPKDIVPWLFCTRDGDCYVKEDGTANGFDSLWQRFMTRVIERTAVGERFQEKDLRKKTASDMGLDDAARLLGHTSPRTTSRHYRLKGERVKPHSMKNRVTDIP